MQKFEFSYDKDNDDLFLYSPKSKSKGSVELGDFILDFNSKKQLVGIQLMHATELIKDLIGENISTLKNLLKNLKSCKVEIKPKNNLLIIKIYLLSGVKEIAPVISVPSIRESSPALAAA